MGSRSQRKKERHTQRRKEKRKRQEQARARSPEREHQAEIGIGSNTRHRQRLLKQHPLAWPGETPEDAAVFDDSALSSLPPELVPQATAVREALRDALESRGDDALKRMAAIPRGSSFSEWRLFIRGLVEWLADHPDAAGEAWKRLDRERRPGRIATVMMLAPRSDLEHASPTQIQKPSSPNESNGEAGSSAWDRFDAQQLYHAKLLHRVRFDRLALRVAESGLNVPEESTELLLGPRKIAWLQRFIAEYEDTEPELTAALARAALGRAFAQEYSDLFNTATHTFQGPRHDRRNRLLGFFYYSRFETGSPTRRKAERELDEYLERELPRNEALSPAVRDAIVSQIHFNEAMVLMRPPRGGRMFDLLFRTPDNTKAIQDHLVAAAKAAPANGPVHKAHAEWIESQLDDDRLKKPKREQLETELAAVMQRWSQGLPNEVEPRLWLVDYFLENERLEEARPHVEFLAASRQDDPRVRATPWKWQILEAMRLCRRKTWLAEVPSRLDEAERLWPAWLSKQWLPYLRAAWQLRSGRLDLFEEERRRINEESGRGRDSLADACMMLGAAQQMRITAAELKPLRETVDQIVKKINSVPMDDLLETGGFFWDMQRVQLLYPAYRGHGAAIGKALIARLGKSVKQVVDGVDDERIQKAVLWGSEFRFWAGSYESKLPSFFSNPAIQRHVVFMAAKLNSFLKMRYNWGIASYRELGPRLREAAPSQRDAYYRRWFVQLADQLDDLTAKSTSRFLGFPFGSPWDDDDDDDDDLDFDPDCNCPECRAARKRAASSRSTRS